MDVERHGEEREIPNEPQQPRAAPLPERPLPGENSAVVEEALNQDGRSS